MAMVGLAIVTNLTTWWVTKDVERETRHFKRARLQAAKRGEVLLDDVDFDGKHGAKAELRTPDLEDGATTSGSGSDVSSVDKTTSRKF